MSLRRVWILLRKELREGATNFLFIYAIVTPVLISLLVALVFGDLFAQKPRLGVYDAGDSQVAAHLIDQGHLNVIVFRSLDGLRAATERGAVEVGLGLPVEFDAAIRTGAATAVQAYRWGQASTRNLVIIESAIQRAVLAVGAYELPVTVRANQLGAADTTSWSQRMLPLIIIMAVSLGGLVIPGSSLIEEKQKRTLAALTSTPTTLLEVFTAKTLIGILVSTVMGIVILALNNAFGNQPALLATVVAMGAIMASVIGILMGSLVKDMDGLMAVLKVFGIVLFGPGIFELVPQIPQWIGRFFPTYYVVNPLLEISLNGATLGDVAADLAVLAAIVGALLVALVLTIERQQKQLALAN